MQLNFDQGDIEHAARHLSIAPELGGKFNSKIDNPEKLLEVLVNYLNARVDVKAIDWHRNIASDTDTAELSFTDTSEIKEAFGISEKEPLGYHYVVEITENLRPKIVKKPRGTKGDDKIEVNVVTGIESVPTDELVVHFKKRLGQDDISIATAYPGTHGPFLPNKEKQTEKEYQESIEYWDNHAFIE